ncbi:HAD family hydrolase [Pseudoroseomonas cervicalis]|uniref:HAD family hydrolase n=1 Tax=Teichococcus cervicalis TaxID=204525 RepID=UPI0035E9BDF6
MLIRDAAALEQAGQITLVAFDKTGTLTEGRPRLPRCTRPEAWRGEALTRAAALQLGSEHPLAHAVLAAAGSVLPPAEDFRPCPAGVWKAACKGGAAPGQRPPSARGRRGPRRAGRGRGGRGSPGPHPVLADRHRAARARWRCWPSRIAAPRRRRAVRRLRAQGIATAMLSGDSEAAARAVGGRSACRDRRRGAAGAEGGAHRRRQAEGQRVAMVGTG